MLYFRKIKRQLLSENRLSRFLLYGVGELILLVIGILLAVQINNWNEDRKTRESEQLLLTGLRKEMMANREELLTALSYHKRSQDAAYKLLTIYDGDYRNYKSNELDSLFAEVQMTWSFDPRITILNSIKTAGQINTIQNVNLQAFISNFEEMVRDAGEETGIIRSLIIGRYVPAVDQYISLNTRGKYIGYGTIGTKFRADYAGIFNDRAIESLIAYIHMWKLEEIREAQSVLKNIEESISIAEAEIIK